MNPMPKSSPEKELVKVLDAAQVVDFLEYLQSGKRVVWVNFKAGVAKGFGVTFGMTVVLAVIVWVLTMLVDLPLVGEYFTDAQSYVTEYAETTNYKEDFDQLNQQLQEINENLKSDEGSKPQIQE
jgi:phage shock protein PspC (stress-responsive transcriptional regulator)